MEGRLLDFGTEARSQPPGSLVLIHTSLPIFRLFVVLRPGTDIDKSSAFLPNLGENGGK